MARLYSLISVCCSALLLLRSLGTRQPSGERTATWAMRTSSLGGLTSLLSTTSKCQGLRQTQGRCPLEILTYCSEFSGSGECDKGPGDQLHVWCSAVAGEQPPASLRCATGIRFTTAHAKVVTFLSQRCPTVTRSLHFHPFHAGKRSSSPDNLKTKQ